MSISTLFQATPLKRLSINNQDILAARVGAVLRCRSLEGNDQAA